MKMCISGVQLLSIKLRQPETENYLIKLKSLVQLVVVKLKYKFLHLKEKEVKLFSDSQTGCTSAPPLGYGPSLLSSIILTCTLPGVGLFGGGSSSGKPSMTTQPPKALSFCYQMHFSSMSLSLSVITLPFCNQLTRVHLSDQTISSVMVGNVSALLTSVFLAPREVMDTEQMHQGLTFKKTETIPVSVL